MEINNKFSVGSKPEVSNLVLKDLKSFSKKDLQTLYSYYNVHTIKDLIPKIYKKGNLPSIFVAINENSNDLAKEIIDSPGFDINALNNNGATALIISSRMKNNEITKYLIDRKADLNIEDSYGETALITSIFRNNDEMTKYLIDKGANIDLQNKYGGWALRYSINNSHQDEITKYLIAKGANLDLQSNDNTALIQAIDRGRNEMAKYLIDPPGRPGANIDLQTNDGDTALTVSIKKVNYEMVGYLIDKGAKFSEKDLMLIENNIDLLPMLFKKDIHIPIEIRNKMKHYIELKILELNGQIKLLKRVLDEEEKELLEQNPACHSENIEELEKCVKTGEDIIKYAPGRAKAKNLEKKYEAHPYFNKKGTV